MAGSIRGTARRASSGTSARTGRSGPDGAQRPPQRANRPANREAAARSNVLRFLFGLLYRNRTLYWLASTIPFAGQWRVWQRLVIPRLVGADVLEVGCGTGTLLADMVEEGYRCSAIDQSPAMLAATRDELRHRRLPLEETPVVQASAQRLPFADAAFDSVVSTFPTDYIYDPATLREIRRVLRPHGRLIIVLGATLLPTRLAVAPLVWFQSLVYGRSTRWASDSNVATDRAGAPQQKTSDPLASALAQAGLVPQADHVRGPFWEAYILIGDKA